MYIDSPEKFRDDALSQVRRIYVLFAQGLFKVRPRGHFHWEPSISETEIVITNENCAKLDVIGKRPAITFTRGPVQFLNIGIDDLDKYDMASGAKQKSVIVPGTMSINCCSRNALESESLAWFYAEQLWMHREALMASGMFEIGRQPTIGPPSPPGSIVQGDNAEEWYVTTITSPFQFYRTSRATPLGAEMVRDISISMDMVRNPGGDKGPLGAPGANQPYSLEDGSAPPGTRKIRAPWDPTKEVYARPVHPYRPGPRR